MPPFVALMVWLVLLLALLYFDPAKVEGTSWALWVPVIWISIVASRLPSQWLGVDLAATEAEALQDGNPLDRAVWTGLIVLAIAVLLARSFRWGDFLMRNLALVMFLLFALVSLMWSDFPFVTFRKWFRDFGAYAALLVALSDPNPLEGVRTLLRRLGYLLVPLSILLIKYYINLGSVFDKWSGQIQYTGAATSKNMLGLLCMVCGIFFFWDTLSRWPQRKEPRTKRILLVNFAFLAMTAWLMHLTHSATSTVCLALGCAVIAMAQSKSLRGVVKVLAPASFMFYVILAWGFGMSGELASAVGRDPTLTDRTEIWSTLLGMHTNPVLGTGYQSFWLGWRLDYFGWKSDVQVTSAHNGYLGLYLELGILGLILLCSLLISSYRLACRRLSSSDALGSLGLAFWTVLLFYNVTETAFECSLLWFAFMTGAIAVYREAEGPAPSASAYQERALYNATDSSFDMAGGAR